MSFKITFVKFNNTKEHIKCKTKEVKDVYIDDATRNWRSKKIAVVKVNGSEVWRCPKNHKK